MEKLTVFWFRRDLRLDDNKGLYKALTSGNKVIPIFIFDTEITSKLERNDARLNFIYNALGGINNTMRGNRCRIGLYRGTPRAVIKKIIQNFSVEKVVVNHDYEPYAKNRDEEIKAFLKEKTLNRVSAIPRDIKIKNIVAYINKKVVFSIKTGVSISK